MSRVGTEYKRWLPRRQQSAHAAALGHAEPLRALRARGPRRKRTGHAAPSHYGNCQLPLALDASLALAAAALATAALALATAAIAAAALAAAALAAAALAAAALATAALAAAALAAAAQPAWSSLHRHLRRSGTRRLAHHPKSTRL